MVSPLVRQANERSDRSNLVGGVKEIVERNDTDCMICEDMKCTHQSCT